MSRATRIQRISQKANNFKGFGEPKTSKYRWYEIEYCFEDDNNVKLIEIRWLKIIEPDKIVKQKIRINAEQANLNPKGSSECDFLALLYCVNNFKNVPQDCNMIYIYRASRFGQCGIVKDFIANIIVDGSVIENDYINQLAFKYCQLVEIVPGEDVTIRNRKKLKRSPFNRDR